MAQPIGLKSHIWNNNLRCILLLALYPVLILAVVWGICFLGHMLFMPRPYENGADLIYQQAGYATEIGMSAAPMIITGVAIWFTIAWFMHGRMIRNMAHSEPVSRSDEPELYNLLENLCIAQGMSTPRLEIIETHARNAFASGIHKGNYTVTVTRGLMNSLSKDELEAVIAHELAHIQNNDVRLLIVTIIFTGLFGFIAQMGWEILWRRMFYGSFSRGSSKNSAGILLFMVLVVALLGLAYLLSQVMRFSLSRKREYMADAGAIEMTKNPEAMMRALLRIAGRDEIPGASRDVALMCIENHKRFMGVFATHPPIEKRVKMISVISNAAVPDAKSLPPIGKKEAFSPDENVGHKTRVNPWLDQRKKC